MKVRLKDYSGIIKEFDINLENYRNLIIVYMIISGDERVYIYNGTELLYNLDSNDTRTISCFDNIKLLTVAELRSLNNE